MMQEREEETVGIESFGGHEGMVLRMLGIGHFSTRGKKEERYCEDR